MIQKIWFTYNKQEFNGSQETQNKMQQSYNNKTCVLKFQIIKNDLKPHNLKLYLINKNISNYIHTWTGSK